MSNTNTEVLTTAYEKLQKALIQADTVLPGLEEAIETGDLQNYAKASDLEEKAQLGYVRQSTDIRPINYTEFDTETKKLFTGGNVAVVGEKAVGKENLKEKAVNLEKVDYSILRNPFTNLLSTDLYVGTGKNGGTIDSDLNGIITFSSTTSYGTFNRILKISDNKKYIVISKVKALEGSGIVARHVCYSYSNTGENLGVTDTITPTDVNQEYVTIVTKLGVKAGGATGHFGVILNRPCKIEIKEQIILDVTGIDDSILDKIDFKDMNYFQYAIENTAIYSKISDKSIIAQKAMSLDDNCVLPFMSKWKGKNALVIGDSITAARQWQLKLKEQLGMNVATHAKGGVGLVQMVDGDKGLGGDYDNETDASGELKPLSIKDVTGIDLIIFFGGYNNRGTADGEKGEVYNPDNQTGNTIAGMIQYCINRIYEVLKQANNLSCKILIVTPHCAGKYPYIDADGYQEYPSGSGRTMETLSNTIKLVSNYNNIPVCDLWHNSGINKFTWDIYGAYPNAHREDITGISGPYPHNGDQLHCSPKGYARIGECIIGSIIKSYGY